ncbi:hypothetical protein NMG60_11019847 [Bertholletia excelsa]
MDPCPFVRIVIGNLALKLPAPTKSGNGPSPPAFFCKIKLRNFPSQTASIPLLRPQDNHVPTVSSLSFTLNKSEYDKLVHRSSSESKLHCLKIEIYAIRTRNACGLISSQKLLGTSAVAMDVKAAESRTRIVQNGWVSIKGSEMQLHLNVRAETDPRFVFQFDGEPEGSPQVFQVNGHFRQPVFTCKFSFKNSTDHNLRSRSLVSEPSTSKSWLSSLRSPKTEQPTRERKGWSITIHDLSGSPVAAASMVTPFVPSPGINHVSRSNPGAWLILRPGCGTWKPWGRLEAWREGAGTGNQIGYRFELLPDAAGGFPDAITLASSVVGAKTGAKFHIEAGSGTSPGSTPSSSCDFGSGFGSGSGSEIGSGSWAQYLYRGFVMSSTVGGVGRPEVEVGVQHVMCTEDAATFVALAAAVELSVDACRPFSEKLREQLRQE